MEMTYSMNIKSSEDRFLRAIVEASLVARRALVPGAFLVDILPICEFPNLWERGMIRLTIGASEVRPRVVPWGGVQDFS